jgi:hypothetical protein
MKYNNYSPAFYTLALLYSVRAFFLWPDKSFISQGLEKIEKFSLGFTEVRREFEKTPP